MANENTPQQSGFTRALASFLRALVRILLVILLAILLALGIFYGLPWAYRQYVAPIQQDISLLQEGQSGQAQYNEQLSDRLESLQGRLEDLEIQSDTGKQLISEIETSLSQMRAALDENLGAIESLQSAPDPEVQALRETVDALEASLTEIQGGLDGMEAALSDLEAEITRVDQNVAGLSEELSAADAPAAQVLRELQIVKAMEHLTRTRLFLAQNNLGLAEAEIQSARSLLEALQPTASEDQAAALDEVIARLEAALDNLPDSPVLAAEDLEVAWQQLTQGMPGSPAVQAGSEAEETATPESSEAPDATPTPTTSS